MKKGDKVSVKQGQRWFPGEITEVRTHPINYAVTRVTVLVVYSDLAGVSHTTTANVPPSAIRIR